MSNHLAEAKAELAIFQQTADPEHLEKAIRSLEQVDLLGSSAGSAGLGVRREVTAAWLVTLKALEWARDPAFNPADRPMLRVVAPSQMGVPPRQSAGPDPRHSSAVVARAEYDAAVAQNQAKADHYGAQTQLKQLEERAMPSVEKLLRRFFSESAADRRELATLIEQAQLSPALRDRLLAIKPR